MLITHTPFCLLYFTLVSLIFELVIVKPTRMKSIPIHNASGFRPIYQDRPYPWSQVSMNEHHNDTPTPCWPKCYCIWIKIIKQELHHYITIMKERKCNHYITIMKETKINKLQSDITVKPSQTPNCSTHAHCKYITQ
jgi:hypothetical protein